MPFRLRLVSRPRRCQRYSRWLLRIAYLSGQISVRYCPESRAYYGRKRADGKRHTPGRARPRPPAINVLWAMLRDNRFFTPAPRQQS